MNYNATTVCPLIESSKKAKDKNIKDGLSVNKRKENGKNVMKKERIEGSNDGMKIEMQVEEKGYHTQLPCVVKFTICKHPTEQLC